MVIDYIVNKQDEQTTIIDIELLWMFLEVYILYDIFPRQDILGLACYLDEIITLYL